MFTKLMLTNYFKSSEIYKKKPNLIIIPTSTGDTALYKTQGTLCIFVVLNFIIKVHFVYTNLLTDIG